MTNLNKTGVSALVATVLLILITVSAVGIIWGAIMPMIGNAQSHLTNDNSTKDCFEATAKIYCSSLNLSLDYIDITRNFDGYLFHCKSERTGTSPRYYFLKSEISECEAKKNGK